MINDKWNIMLNMEVAFRLTLYCWCQTSLT